MSGAAPPDPELEALVAEAAPPPPEDALDAELEDEETTAEDDVALDDDEEDDALAVDAFEAGDEALDAAPPFAVLPPSEELPHP